MHASFRSTCMYCDHRSFTHCTAHQYTERRRQTDLPEKSAPARHTAPARASLASRERVDFKLAVFIFRCLHGLAPRYLPDDIRRVADSKFQPSGPGFIIVGLTDCPTNAAVVTMGNRAFPVASSRLWNSLPHEVTSASTLPVFCSRLKTYLFQLSFPTN